MKQQIDRQALVCRHNPVVRSVQPHAPLSVGNGEFAYTVDLTGMQSYPEAYDCPLGTQSQWGWHYTQGRGRYSMQDVIQQKLGSPERVVGYPRMPDGCETAFHWLRQNPHRLQLAQIGLCLWTSTGARLSLSELENPVQTLDLWSGIIHSTYAVGGTPVEVETCCHPERDRLAVRISSQCLRTGQLAVEFKFPNPRMTSVDWAQDINLNWRDEAVHETVFQHNESCAGVFTRTMDEEKYFVSVQWTAGKMVALGKHAFQLKPDRSQSSFELVVDFAPQASRSPLPGFMEIRSASAQYWSAFWQEGGAVELMDSRDTRAEELERRIVLSQFLTAVHCAGTLPPQETGLLYNSWFGKFHLEMHWWHAAHFPLWGRSQLLQRSMSWYLRALPAARALAQSQGYAGARWPKMVGPDGVQSPSAIGTLLIWQQPHPIALAELLYQSAPTPETLSRYGEMVLATAEFMASFVRWDDARQRYVLGPPVIPAQEAHEPMETFNPTFELAYWRHGLELANVWRTRMGLQPFPKWQHICAHLSALPVKDGVYLAHENCPDTYSAKCVDHPSMLAALGILPGGAVAPDVMYRTLQRVLECWDWTSTWGWDFPMIAMTAARLGDGHTAVDMLLMDTTKNTYLSNGHNYQRPDLMAYLPGNGGLLTAVAMMAAGWRGAPKMDAPGFPDDGSWTVRYEGLHPWL